MKKRLVFHCYINNGWKENRVNKIHFQCLQYFSYVFNEIIFVIVVDDIDDINTIYDVESYILSLRICPNIKFIIKKNNLFRDSQTFYDEIAQKLKEMDGLTFFAHNKGLTNYIDQSLSKSDVEKWITSMYFGGLSNIEEAEYMMTEGRLISYGSLLCKCDEDTVEDYIYRRRQYFLGENMFNYIGTFFWVNAPVLCDYMKNTKKELPHLNDRWYAENFLSNIISFDFAASYGGRFLIGSFDMYYNTKQQLETFFGDKYVDFENFHKIIVSEIE